MLQRRRLPIQVVVRYQPSSELGHMSVSMYFWGSLAFFYRLASIHRLFEEGGSLPNEERVQAMSTAYFSLTQ